jgi:Leucine-rich repeat (LRR) protein
MKLLTGKLLLALLFLYSTAPLLAQSSCSSTLAQEYAALIALYQSTNGSSWTNNTGWRDADPNVVQSVVGWYGVTTDNDGHVMYLGLNGNNLIGNLPLSIGNLCTLQSLSLAANQLSGSVPSEIGDLRNLIYLSLRGNNLSGTIPSSIGNLTELTNLELNNNQLSGEIPASIGNLTKLIFFHLRINHLSGSIPSTIGNLTAAENIAFDSNELSGSIPSSIGNLGKLGVLWLQANQLTGSIPSEIGNLTKLFNLALQDNRLTGSIPSSIGNLTELTNLQLNNNQLSGEIPASIGNLTKLIFFHLRINQLSGPIPSTIGNLTVAENIAFDVNHLSGSIPSSIGNLGKLGVLWLQANQLTGSIPSEIGNLAKLSNLALQDNRLAGSIPSSIGNLTELTDLVLSNNQLSGEIPASIGNLTKLTFFHLRINQLTGAIPSTIGNLTAAQNIAFDSNQLTGPIPSSVGNMMNLGLLWLRGNRLSGEIPLSFAGMNKLKNLDVGTNQLRGVVPSIPGIIDLNSSTNSFTFSDILPAKANFSGSTFSYSPQALIDEEKTIQAIIGSSYTLTTSVDRNTTPASSYQWFKVVNGVTTSLNTASTDGHTVIIPAVVQADAGTQFYYTITNTEAPGLILASKLQALQIVTCPTPTLDFQSDELDGTHTFTPSITGENCTATYTWDFGDGTTSSEQAPQHAYTSTGTFTITLNVSSTCGTCPVTELIQQHNVTIAGSSLCASIFCDGAGGVGIGTQKTEGFRLSVNGKIRASDIIKVYPQTQWSDFVFDKGYKLRPLTEVESFIKTNGHLPEIPSAKEVAKEGIDLGAMDAKLLQKVEELTLYIIKMNEGMSDLNRKIEKLEKENNKLKQEIRKH